MRSNILTALGMAVLLGSGLAGCAGPNDSPRWSGSPGYRSPYYADPGYYGRPGYYRGGPGYYRGRYADRFDTYPHQRSPRWADRPERRAAPRIENWNQDRLRQHWEERARRNCGTPGAGC